jgi:hypothetical protein
MEIAAQLLTCCFETGRIKTTCRYMWAPQMSLECIATFGVSYVGSAEDRYQILRIEDCLHITTVSLAKTTFA